MNKVLDFFLIQHSATVWKKQRSSLNNARKRGNVKAVKNEVVVHNMLSLTIKHT